tara:strand:- start:80 stop:289 length:210 start_codon:yes stop_codon:yes gene_type:complete
VDSSPPISRSSHARTVAGVTVEAVVAVGFAVENGVSLEQAKARAITSPTPANSIFFIRILKANELFHAC